ncbi:hypothetical protein [Egibacter rhizosphaerae]|uniref:hypothetical protein n=1 Tax=Egibacter rhizosphaerae TaxID=1670831 RepID=UPI0013F153C5|nr:hypothetical protein [Egibacter rhizosphaerae]
MRSGELRTLRRDAVDLDDDAAAPRGRTGQVAVQVGSVGGDLRDTVTAVWT